MTITVPTEALHAPHATTVPPEPFDPTNHSYAKVQNAQVHPMVAYFMRMSPDALVARYCHLNPAVSATAMRELLASRCQHLRWAGADLLHATDIDGRRRMVVLETNSCPSGNKSMPLLDDADEMGGYGRLLRGVFLPTLRRRRLPAGRLAVLWDKNLPEASGYAAALAALTNEPVLLAPFPDVETPQAAKFVDGVLHVREETGAWVPIRAALRYVTQRPWNRIPVGTRTALLNPVIGCLAGGRNKLLAAKAYALQEASLRGTGLCLRTPRTIRDLGIEEVPMQVERLGGHAVVKVPYSNAGQGVYTITSEAELAAFMDQPHHYNQFVVQGLIGNSAWSSDDVEGRLFHVGTLPDRRGRIYAADLRVMVMSTPEGFRPVSIYARRAAAALTEQLDATSDSWSMLGTNLSVKGTDGGWSAETDRLLMMDTRDFNRLGVGLDSLIEAYVQAVLATLAIDNLSCRLLNTKGKLKRRLFRSMNDDEALLSELY